MSAFSDELHEHAIEPIASFSVGISGIDVHDNVETAFQSGTGTLVNVDGTRCIITADHVIEHICRRDRIGLLIDWHGGLRRCVFERNVLRFVRLPRGPTPDTGPDLGAILLPLSGEAIGTLRSFKNFYNLTMRIDRFSGRYLPLSEGVWIPCGVLGEGSQVLSPTIGFANVTGHWALMGAATAPLGSFLDGYDYLDLRAQIGDTDVPDTFGGASGGGLWQVRIAQHPDGRLEVHEVIFSGVIFYESAVKDGMRILRSHGRVSVHERVVEAIRNAVSGRN